MFISERLERITDSDAVIRNDGTDDILPNEVERVLQSTGYQDLRGNEIFVHYGVVFLRGQVPSFHMKQVAQTAARSVSGVREVRNELNVLYSR
jgi:osmotically-inducible protein OsmY